MCVGGDGGGSVCGGGGVIRSCSGLLTAIDVSILVTYMRYINLL